MPDPLSLRVEAQGGSFDTQRYNAAANGTAGALDYGGAVNYYDTARHLGGRFAQRQY